MASGTWTLMVDLLATPNGLRRRPERLLLLAFLKRLSKGGGGRVASRG